MAAPQVSIIDAKCSLHKQKLKENPLTPQQLNDIKAKFQKYDKDGSGALDRNEMRALLEETLHRKITDKMLDSYVALQFSAEDKNFNGVIEFDEFVSLYRKIYIDPELPIHLNIPPPNSGNQTQLESGSNAPKVHRETAEDVFQRLTPQQIEEAKAKFKQYDKDGSNTIDKNELGELLQETMSKKMSAMVIKRYVDAQFQMYDKDGSGAISWDEFIILYEKMYVHGEKGLTIPGPAPGSKPPPGGRGQPMPGM